MERQAILDRPSPPTLWVVLDEAVLHRLIGSRAIMCDQLQHLFDISCRSNLTVQIVPGSMGAHAGLLGGFAIAGFDNAASTVYLESPDHGQTTQLPSMVARLSLTFDTLSVHRRAEKGLKNRPRLGWPRRDCVMLAGAPDRRSCRRGP
ncbi:MAG: DUF5753 domain-containing protein [Streptosporangiaceae bacterium]